nr:hypothetical protein [uncultured Marinifilum sp.]
MKEIIAIILILLCSNAFSQNGQVKTTTGTADNLYYKNGRVGVGTSSPSKLLEVQDSNYSSGESYIWVKKGINATPANREAGLILGTNASDFGNCFKIVAKSPNSYFGTPNLQFTFIKPSGKGVRDLFSINSFGNVGIGTNNPNFKLDVLGTIRAQDLKVDMEGADFVFEEDYLLRSIEEVETFVKANKHLPEISPAKEMQENGVNQSEMNQKLLQKIEELTLYLIQQNKELKSQTQEISALKEEVKQLRSAQ